VPQKLYNIKGRDAKVPLAVCVADPQVRVWRKALRGD
jgi:tRNA A37 threonylcarbamoyladenosine synthetase subunit TsaC/SUA5/YrdC